MQNIRTICADGQKAVSAKNKLYDGLGMVSANNSSRLLLDYKAEYPEVYRKLLEYIFGKNGLGISLIKIEMGADVDSSSGTEPAVMRSADEKADVTRGAGYQLAADALKIDPDIKIDLLYWGLPAWVAGAEDTYDAMYRWYRSTIDAMYDTYGIKVTHVTVNQNERGTDTEWVKYFSRRLKAETDERYDYDTIQIVCGEAVGTWEIADYMLEDEELMNAVDIVTSHYTSWTTDNVKLLQDKYGKKIWFSEGSAPMNRSELTYRYDGSGISGVNGMLDIASRITQAMAEGITMYEFQPVISAYYSGVTYYPKQLITANEPWSGAYSPDAGFYMCLHFSQFIKKGWRFIDGACFGDGHAGGDGHAVVGSVFNYITCVDENRENCSVVLVNCSPEEIEYGIELSNMSCTESKFFIWETRGPEAGEDHYSRFFRKTGTAVPENGRLRIVIKPFSMLTVSTVDVKEYVYGNSGSKILPLPYSDNFEYAEYDENYLEERGGAPRYTTDQGGAFEVGKIKGKNVLIQKITEDIQPKEWAYTPPPVTNLGDDRWANYTVSINAHFADNIPESDKSAYVGIGARYNLADRGFSGYWLRLWINGCCELMKDDSAVIMCEIQNFEPAKMHGLSVSVCNEIVECSVDGEKIISFEDKKSIIISGRAAIYSSCHRNYFDGLQIEAIEGAEPYITRIDAFDGKISYSEGGNTVNSAGWYHNAMSSYKNYNRTVSVGHSGDTMEFSFEGSAFAVLGETEAAVIGVEIDGRTVSDRLSCTGGLRQAFYFRHGLENGCHTVRITVIEGTIQVDAAEYQ